VHKAWLSFTTKRASVATEAERVQMSVSDTARDDLKTLRVRGLAHVVA